MRVYQQIVMGLFIMKDNIIMLAKLILTYLWNGIKVVRFRNFGRNSSIMRGLQVHNPSGVFISNNVRIGKFARLSCYPIKAKLGSILIGDNCYIGDFFSVLSADCVEIKNDVLFASYVTLIGENHGMDPECGIKYGLQELTGGKVVVNDHCWIGEKVIIMPGVTIGAYSIIGAGSVVTHDVPDYSLAVGNPAKIIKRYDFEQKKWIKV